MKYLALLILPLLVACSENYRYPCQDPDNWDKQICKKPWCSANGTCPEDLQHYEKKNLNSNQPGVPTPTFQQKGDCK
jgi:hypothetical protein